MPRPKIAMVLGGAVTLPYDVQEYTMLHVYHYVVACNEAGIWWRGDLDCWSTLHPEKMDRWLETRLGSGATMPKMVNVFANRRHRRTVQKLEAKYQIKVEQSPLSWGKASGSSGLFATKAAFEIIGADRVVLCGIPLSKQKNMFRLHTTQWTPGAYRKAWDKIPSHIVPHIKSMSGWTKGRFGPPTDFPLREVDTASRQC